MKQYALREIIVEKGMDEIILFLSFRIIRVFGTTNVRYFLSTILQSTQRQQTQLPSP
jgi:hypothetical protein